MNKQEITVSASLELLGEAADSLLEELLKIKDPRPVLLRIGTEEYEGDMWVKAGEVLIRVPREALEIPTHAEFQPPENISMSFFEYAESPNFPLELSELSLVPEKYQPGWIPETTYKQKSTEREIVESFLAMTKKNLKIYCPQCGAEAYQIVGKTKYRCPRCRNEF